MSKPDFVYTTFIKTTPEKCWAALTTPEFTRQYWGESLTSDWRPGSDWHSVNVASGSVNIAGKVRESTPPRRLVLTWAHVDNRADESIVTFEIAQVADMVRLDVVHGRFQPGSEMAERVSMGWPRVLSSLKTFLETGAPLDTWARFESACHSPSNAAGAAAA